MSLGLIVFTSLVLLGVAVGLIAFTCCNQSPETEEEFLDRQF